MTYQVAASTGAVAFVAVGQLDLGEEVAAEALFAQGADFALLAIELRGFGGRKLRPGAGADDQPVSPRPSVIA